jgi:hypothetical protein
MASLYREQMKTALADYVLRLSEALAHTKHASDRPLYERYLADAAVLLALVERGADVQEVKQRVANHERLWSQTWAAGGEYKDASEAWKKFKDLLKMESAN